MESQKLSDLFSNSSITNLKITSSDDKGSDKVYKAEGKINGRQFSVTLQSKEKLSAETIRNILNYSKVYKIKEEASKGEAKITLKPHEGHKEVKITVMSKRAETTQEFKYLKEAKPLDPSKTQQIFNSFKAQVGKVAESAEKFVQDAKDGAINKGKQIAKPVLSGAQKTADTASSILTTLYEQVGNAAKDAGSAVQKLLGRIQKQVKDQASSKLTNFNPIMGTATEIRHSRELADLRNAQLSKLQEYFDPKDTIERKSGEDYKSQAINILNELDDIITDSAETTAKKEAIGNLLNNVPQLEKNPISGQIRGDPDLLDRYLQLNEKFHNKFDEKPAPKPHNYTSIPITRTKTPDTKPAAPARIRPLPPTPNLNPNLKIPSKKTPSAPGQT